MNNWSFVKVNQESTQAKFRVCGGRMTMLGKGGGTSRERTVLFSWK